MMPKGSQWSPEDQSLADSRKWYIAGAGYVMDSNGIYFHREVMNNPADIVDHKNGDRLDNRRENLRVLTKAKNCANRTVKHPRNTSGHNGVTRCWTTGRWRAYVKENYKQIHLGRYDTPEEANDAVVKWKEERGLRNP